MWTSECLSSFNAAKDLLCTAPVLSAPKFSSPFKLQVDASATGGRSSRHSVFYFSKKFSKTHQNYSTIEKEAFRFIVST